MLRYLNLLSKPYTNDFMIMLDFIEEHYISFKYRYSVLCKYLTKLCQYCCSYTSSTSSTEPKHGLLTRLEVYITMTQTTVNMQQYHLFTSMHVQVFNKCTVVICSTFTDKCKWLAIELKDSNINLLRLQPKGMMFKGSQ